MSETLQRALTEIRSGDKETGQRLLAEVIRNDPRNATAWLWMSSAIDSDDHRRYCLERVLAINPQNQTAKRELEALSQKQTSGPLQPEQQPEPMPSASADALLPVRRIEQEATKKCPYCAETIKADAVACRSCGRDLRAEQPVSQPPKPTQQVPKKTSTTTGYVEQNLMAGEQVVYRTRLHWVIFILPTILIVGGVLLTALSFTATAEAGSCLCGIGGILSLLAILGLVASGVALFTSEFAVTDKRVIVKAGFIRRRSMELLLAKVESINVDQPLLGRILGYGTIVITGTGGTLEPFKNLDNPLELRRQVQLQISNTS